MTTYSTSNLKWQPYLKKNGSQIKKKALESKNTRSERDQEKCETINRKIISLVIQVTEHLRKKYLLVLGVYFPDSDRTSNTINPS